MKKRIFAFIMCVVLCMTLCIPAYATESSTTSILNIGGVDYAYTREKSAREITVTMENEDVLLRAVYDKVENTLSFYQSDLESTAAASTNAMADAPNIFLDLNQNILEYPIMPMRTCITFYYSEFFGNYYAYTSYTDGSYDILHDTDPMVITPANIPGPMSRTCRSYYTAIRNLDSDSESAFDAAVAAVQETLAESIPIYSNIKDVCDIIQAVSGQTSTEDCFISCCTTMISALPGFEYFSLAMSIANVGYAWGCIGADIWNLGNIYDDIYAVYGKR